MFAVFNLGFFWSNTIVWLLRIVSTLYVIYYGRKNPRSTIIWIIVVNLIPVVGFVLFLMFGQNTKKTKMFSLKKENDDIIEQITYNQYRQISDEEYVYTDKEISDFNQLIKLNLVSDNAYFTEDNDIKLFYWGREKFGNLIKDIRSAKKSIDIQYYIFRTDDTGKRVLQELHKKAKQGVKVRFLYDDLGSRFANKKYFRALEAVGAEVIPFFPGILGLVNFRLNYRNHRKLVIIDDLIGYTGGFNVGDEYLGRKRKFGPWRDTHLRIQGGAILGLKIRFLKDWYYASGQEPNLEDDLNPLFISEGKASTQVISSGPDTANQNIKNALLQIINTANETLYIQSPYLVPDFAIYEAIKLAVLRGVDVNIMIPNNPDHISVHWCSMSFARDLAKYGVKIYAFDEGFMHAKVVFADDIISTIGTTNIDERSFLLNFETNVVIYDRDINRQLREQFDKDIQSSILLTPEYFDHRPWYVKAREPIARIFSPLF